jgi:molybdate transport system regulatory protein
MTLRFPCFGSEKKRSTFSALREKVMKISTRNVFSGTVTELTVDSVNSEVVITTPGGDKLVAIVTVASVKSLGLSTGKEAIALFKASSVVVMTESDGIKLSARNAFAGTVKSVTQGAINDDVVIALKGGSEIHAVVTHGATTELGLKHGVPATAIIKASSILVGAKG